MALQHDALERRAFSWALVPNHLICTGLSLSSALKCILDLLAVVFIIGLRKYLIASLVRPGATGLCT
jgi:hypothetical protein